MGRKKHTNIYVSCIKPLLDRFLGITGLVIMSWLFVLIAAAIVLDDPGPVLFRQKRVGKKKNGKITYFEILKFRTMKTCTPKDVPTHLLADPEQYITRVGRFLRRTSLDELPQLWNIGVRGDLSIIGPRPALWNQDDLVAEREKYGANDVTPGLTGWAQINGRDELPIDVKARYDGEYTERLQKSSLSGIRMDLRCFLGTLRYVLRGEGVVEGGTGSLSRSVGANCKEYKILFVANVAKEHMLKFHVPAIKEFTRQGWTVDAACSGEEEIPYCRRQYHMCWKRSPFTVKTIQGILQLKRILDKENYDIVYCHTPVGGIAARIAAVSARKHGTRVIYCAHGFHFFKGAPAVNWLLYYPVEKLLAHLTDVILTVNREDYRNAKNHFTKKTIIRLAPEVGVNFNRLQVADPENVRRQYREDLGIPENASVMIYVAELIPNKNQGMLISALRILREKGRNVYLILPGPDHAEGYFQQYASDQGMDQYCRFLGWRSDIGQLMSASDICTASSIREGFGINLVEAMYCGLPVVATDNRGHRMVIKEGYNGYLVEIGDSEAMAERVEEILFENRIPREQVKSGIQKYDCDHIAKLVANAIIRYAKKARP